MSKRRRSRDAWICLILFLLVQISFYFWAKCNPSPWFGGDGKWETRDAAIAMAMGFLLLAALIMHEVDYKRKKKGWGFLDVYCNIGGGPQKDEQEFVGAALTAESIRAAMTAVLIGILVDNRDKYPLSGPDPHWHPIPLILKDPVAVFYLVIVGTLAVSLVTTTVGLLCYEYATRFTWNRDWPKRILLRKGHWFGTVGFYCLMWSLAVIPVLLDYRLAFLSIAIVFLVMWLYYYYPMPLTQPATAKLVILHDTSGDAGAFQNQLAEHLDLIKAFPDIRSIETSTGPITGDLPSPPGAISMLSFDSMASLDSAWNSTGGKALTAALTTAGAKYAKFEDEKL